MLQTCKIINDFLYEHPDFITNKSETHGLWSVVCILWDYANTHMSCDMYENQSQSNDV